MQSAFLLTRSGWHALMREWGYVPADPADAQTAEADLVAGLDTWMADGCPIAPVRGGDA